MTANDYRNVIGLLIERILNDANDTIANGNNDVFNQAEKMTYYKVLESIKDSIEMSALNAEEFGLKESEIDKLLK